MAFTPLAGVESFFSFPKLSSSLSESSRRSSREVSAFSEGQGTDNFFGSFDLGFSTLGSFNKNLRDWALAAVTPKTTLTNPFRD